MSPMSKQAACKHLQAACLLNSSRFMPYVLVKAAILLKLLDAAPLYCQSSITRQAEECNHGCHPL